jgi:superfamily II DNA or RNA helicase
MHFGPCWTAPPAIVAEELVAVPDPLLTALRPGPTTCGAAVAASLARSVFPAEDCAPAPAWLLPGQHRSFRQTVAAVRRYGGAVLADPVGSGKTYVALAVAAAFNRSAPTACVVPATLLAQWEAVAKGLGVRLALGSHEQASRGRLPQGARGMVILDESHHYRNPLTRRYIHLASWLGNRPALLVTATPIVNRLADLGNQLYLSVRDDALALEGIPSLRTLLQSGCPHPALGQVVVENEALADARPRRISRMSAPDERGTPDHAVDLLNRLRLSRNESIAGLIRRVLLRAAASSPAALAGALKRYRRLLLHARDAFQRGRAMERGELRRFTDDLGDQLVWWELLPYGDGSSDLELSDLAELERVIPAATAALQESDPKLSRLREILSEEKPAVVFTTSRDTVQYIRDRLGDLRLAWCTGDRAGIGRALLPRRSVLAWFREGVQVGPGPRHLVVTDVAAEGLDLQRAGRIVHYDLPWTPMRLEQREGRAVRLGSRHSEVEVVRFAPPASLEGRLRLEETLARKAKLPAAAGLGPGGRHIWRWRAELAERFGGAEAVAGVARVPSSLSGLLAGFALYCPTDPARCLSATVGWLDVHGVWIEAPEVVAERLMAAAARSRHEKVDAEQLRKYLELLAPVIRDRLGPVRARRWVSPDPTAAARNVAKRLGGLIHQAARLRQDARLLQLERALAFVAGAHTAGEEILIERLAEAPDSDILAELTRVKPQPSWEGIEARLTGLIVFGPVS